MAMYGSKSATSTLLHKAVLLTLILCAKTIAGSCEAASHKLRAPGHLDHGLRVFLQKYLDNGPEMNRTARYTVAHVSLAGNGKRQILVQVTGMSWCGSGGCPIVLLDKVGDGFSVIETFTQGWRPIYVLPGKTNGWHDLAINVHGGGIIQPYMALLRFDGKKYPSNPTMVKRLPPNGLDHAAKVEFRPGSTSLFND